MLGLDAYDNSWALHYRASLGEDGLWSDAAGNKAHLEVLGRHLVVEARDFDAGRRADHFVADRSAVSTAPAAAATPLERVVHPLVLG